MRTNCSRPWICRAASTGGRRSSRVASANGSRSRVRLANHPRLLLADEPTGSLDSRSVTRVLDLMGRLRDREEVTVVVVTHDDHVAAAADRIIHMEDGRVADADSDDAPETTQIAR